VGVSGKNPYELSATFEGCRFSENQGVDVVTYSSKIFSSTNLTTVDVFDSEDLACYAPDSYDEQLIG
jgi:hypothetical protein